MVSYACATLGQTLLTSILEKIQSNHLKTTPTTVLKDVVTNGDACQPAPESGLTSQSIEELLQKLKDCCDDSVSVEKNNRDQLKLERTSSLPPLGHTPLGHTHKQPAMGQLSAPPGNPVGEKHTRREVAVDEGIHSRTRSHGEADYRPSSGSNRSRQGNGYVREAGHSRGASGCVKDELFYESCGAEADLDLRQRPKRERRCNRCSNNCHHSKKKRGRSRSDGSHTQGSGMLVDTSLDDDCPGVPENRVRRPARHQQHHICKQCMAAAAAAAEKSSGTSGRVRIETRVSGLGPVAAGGLGRRGWSRQYSPDLERMTSGRFRGTNHSSTLIMTLEDVRTAAMLLEKSTEFERLESGEEENGSGGSSDEHQVKVHPDSVSDHRVRVHSRTEDNETAQPMLEMSYSNRPSRSGRDSPATDMAVACLDMNSAKMLEPLNAAGSLGTVFVGDEAEEGVESVQHLHLHNHSHHHYHHVIHHHSQP